MKYGYARVSTDGQSVAAQVAALTKAGCRKVFREVASGAKTNPNQLRKALDQLASGDVLMVTRLDRLARSTRDLLNTLAMITEFERDLIRARTGEGRARAVARGVKMGRPSKLTPHQRREAIKRRARGEALTEIGRSYNVSAATISRLAV